MKIYLRTEKLLTIDFSEAKRIFNAFKRSSDILIIDEEVTRDTRTETIIVDIYNKTRCNLGGADFYIQIIGDATERNDTMDSIKYLPTSEEDLPKILNNLIITFLGYSRVILKGITVKDISNNKIKQEIEIYIQRVPYVNIPEELVYDKSRTKQRADFNKNLLSSNENCEFRTDNVILKCLLEEYVLNFNENVTLLYDDNSYQIILLQKTSYTFIQKTMFDLDENSKINTLFEKHKITSMENIRNALTAPYSDAADRSFYSELEKIKKNKSKKSIDFLHTLVCCDIKVNEFKKPYLNEIEGMFKGGAVKGGLEGKCYDIEADTHYLKIRVAMIIDKIPVGSLKELFWS